MVFDKRGRFIGVCCAWTADNNVCRNQEYIMAILGSDIVVCPD